MRRPEEDDELDVLGQLALALALGFLCYAVVQAVVWMGWI